MNKILGVLGSMPYNQVAELLTEVQVNTKVIEKPQPQSEESETAETE